MNVKKPCIHRITPTIRCIMFPLVGFFLADGLINVTRRPITMKPVNERAKDQPLPMCLLLPKNSAITKLSAEINMSYIINISFS